MQEETILIPEIIEVIMHEDGKSAIGTGFQNKDVKYKVQEIMLGAGSMRKSIPWMQGFLKENTECRAEVLENGRLRII